ncbi:uncharacterized protein TMBIM7P isoform X2 [Pan troglodytes]|uniref:uncharacterized protein TMBIM7P isoform X2 n=1 Tax=Pan troglodytes TaxID=9598 RepID=UPI003013A8EA
MGNSCNHSGDASTHFVCSTNKMGFYLAKWSTVRFLLRAFNLWNYLNLRAIILAASIICWTRNCALLTLLGDRCAAHAGRAPPLFPGP